MILTAAEVAVALDVNVEDARGLIRFLKAVRIITHRGVRIPANKRGRGEDVYEFPDDLGQRVAKAIAPVRSDG